MTPVANHGTRRSTEDALRYHRPNAIKPCARRLKTLLEDYAAPRPASALILIGPEGDFTPSEVGLAKSAGCQPLSLGPIILRTETAALYSLSVLENELF